MNWIEDLKENMSNRASLVQFLEDKGYWRTIAKNISDVYTIFSKDDAVKWLGRTIEGSYGELCTQQYTELANECNQLRDLITEWERS